MASLSSMFAPPSATQTDQAKAISLSARRLAGLARQRLSDAETVATDDERNKIYTEVRSLVDEAAQLNKVADRLLSAVGR